ncbi:UreD-domain-containing protein [Rickenella mellea]|uniref:UreD-domain-containing protein n=1 Tax=Rickenella mellea TaxID=50990 RepID=A0A4Y7QMJ1_9AGAM|nr:UreD-domain-containing protein [Rickenella mellea]
MVMDTAASSVPPQKLAGTGNITLHLHGHQAVFSELSYCYPLKLLSPRIAERAVAIAYVLSYGGGLVGGDRINLRTDVGSGARLLLLTQGSTKIFKQRVGLRASSVHPASADGERTIQVIDAAISADALLLLLPDPVTCFSDAFYNQKQTFRLEIGASIVLLDWITAGRVSRGEEWDFSRYCSINEVWVGDKRVARDAQLLEKQTQQSGSKFVPLRSLKDRLGHYSCYATLLLYGPLVVPTITTLAQRYASVQVYQQNVPPDFVWSLASLENGCVVRLAGKETELVKFWLRDSLKGLESVVGIDALRNAFV